MSAIREQPVQRLLVTEWVKNFLRELLLRVNQRVLISICGMLTSACALITFSSSRNGFFRTVVICVVETHVMLLPE